jgi:hypothetical protein
VLFKLQKNWFQWLKPKYVAYPDQWGTCCKELTAGSKSADSRNGLFNNVSKARVSLQLQLKLINSNIPISAISQ